MSDKLWAKLRRKSITKPELETLLTHEGFWMQRQKGSHEIWKNKTGDRLVLAAHGKDLKPYQMKEALEILEKKR